MNALGCRGNKTFALSLAPHRTQSSPAKSVQSRDPMLASHLTFLTRLLANHIGQRADKIGGGKFHFHAPIGAPVNDINLYKITSIFFVSVKSLKARTSPVAVVDDCPPTLPILNTSNTWYNFADFNQKHLWIFLKLPWIINLFFDKDANRKITKEQFATSARL